jgi:hypothetical protein
MTTIAEALEALLRQHDRIGAPLREFLIAGRPADEIRARLQGLGLAAPDDLLDFYSWQDGVANAVWRRRYGGRELGLVPPGSSPSLDQAEAEYRMLREVSISIYGSQDLTEIPEAGYWAATWFPIVLGNRSYAVDCAGGSQSHVWLQSSHPGSGGTAIACPSLVEFLLDVAGRFERQVYSWRDDVGQIQYDGDALIREEREAVARAARAAR